MDVNRAREMFDQFKDHHRSKETLSADWDAEWRKWCRNEQKFKSQKQKKRRRGEYEIGDQLTRDDGTVIEYAGNGVAGGWLEIG